MLDQEPARVSRFSSPACHRLCGRVFTGATSAADYSGRTLTAAQRAFRFRLTVHHRMLVLVGRVTPRIVCRTGQRHRALAERALGNKARSLSVQIVALLFGRLAQSVLGRMSHSQLTASRSAHCNSYWYINPNKTEVTEFQLVVLISMCRA